MAEFIGVINLADYFPMALFRDSFNLFKREALLFQRIAVPALCSLIEDNRREKKEPLPCHSGIEWLMDNNIVFAPEKLVGKKHIDAALVQQLDSNKDYAHYLEEEARLNEQLNDDYKKISSVPRLMLWGDNFDPFQEKREKFGHEFDKTYAKLQDVTTRSIAVGLRLISDMEAIPLVSTAPPNHQENRTAAIKIVFNSLPVPSSSTSWEQIIEYRSDPNSHYRFLALRNWIGEVARAELSQIEIEQKLEYLISQYQQHMKLHKIKTNVGTFETIVVTTAEVLGDLVSFKWGKAAAALFLLKKRNIALLEGELTAPGSEVAYIVKANEMFIG